MNETELFHWNPTQNFLVFLVLHTGLCGCWSLSQVGGGGGVGWGAQPWPSHRLAQANTGETNKHPSCDIGYLPVHSLVCEVWLEF